MSISEGSGLAGHVLAKAQRATELEAVRSFVASLSLDEMVLGAALMGAPAFTPVAVPAPCPANWQLRFRRSSAVATGALVLSDAGTMSTAVLDAAVVAAVAQLRRTIANAVGAALALRWWDEEITFDLAAPFEALVEVVIGLRLEPHLADFVRGLGPEWESTAADLLLAAHYTWAGTSPATPLGEAA